MFNKYVLKWFSHVVLNIQNWIWQCVSFSQFLVMAVRNILQCSSAPGQYVTSSSADRIMRRIAQDSNTNDLSDDLENCRPLYNLLNQHLCTNNTYGTEWHARWHRMARQMAPSGMTDGTEWRDRKHRMTWQMAPSGMTDVNKWHDRWHRVARQMSTNGTTDGTEWHQMSTNGTTDGTEWHDRWHQWHDRWQEWHDRCHRIGICAVRTYGIECG